MYESLYGNDLIKERLSLLVKKRRVGHALLFVGPEGVGKGLFALSLAADLMETWESGRGHAKKVMAGEHPDVHIYHPEGKLGLHSIETVRKLCEEVYMPPFEAPWKVFIIHHADRMLTYSANALLKTFEEPPERTVIILIGHATWHFLPTILSRCSVFYFQGLSAADTSRFLKEQQRLDENQISTALIAQSRGSLARAKKVAEEGDLLRDKVLSFLAQGACLDYKMLQKEIGDIVAVVDSAKKQVEEREREELKAFDHLSSLQKESFEKEIEGHIALKNIQEADTIFFCVDSWYRDIHLLLLGGDEKFLFHPDYKEALITAAQRGGFFSIEFVQKKIGEAKVALSRSTPLSHCLETLFLQLSVV